MGKWVVSLSGERGKGPWLSNKQGGVYPTPNMRDAGSAPSESLAGIWRTSAVHQGYPDARVFRLVRRERVIACPVHAHQIHGGEVEELRRGIEGLISDSAPAGDFCDPSDVVDAGDLQDLIDRVDARDSLAHLEMNRAEEAAVVEAAMAWEACDDDDSKSCDLEHLDAACAALRAKRGG